MTTMGQRMKKREVEEMVLEADLGKNGLINLKGNNFSVLKATLQSQMSVCLPVSKTPQQLEIITRATPNTKGHLPPVPANKALQNSSNSKSACSKETLWQLNEKLAHPDI